MFFLCFIFVFYFIFLLLFYYFFLVSFLTGSEFFPFGVDPLSPSGNYVMYNVILTF